MCQFSGTLNYWIYILQERDGCLISYNTEGNSNYNEKKTDGTGSCIYCGGSTVNWPLCTKTETLRQGRVCAVIIWEE